MEPIVFKNLKISLKLSLAFGLLLVALGGTVVYSLNKMDILKTEFGLIVSDEFPKTVLANNVIDAINAVARASRTGLLAKDDKTIKEERVKIEKGLAQIQDNLDKLTQSVKGDKGRAEIDRVTKARDAYMEKETRLNQLLDAYIQARAQGAKASGNIDVRRDAAVDFLLNDLRPAQHEFTAGVEAAIDFYEANVKQANDEVVVMYVAARDLLIKIAVAVALTAMLFAFFIIRSITHPLGQALRAFDGIKQGNFDNAINIKGRDELGIVLQGLKEMQEKLGADADETQRASTEMAAVLGGLATGDLTKKVAGNYSGAYDTIKHDINRVNETLNNLITQMNHMSAEHDAGDIDVMIDSVQFQGTYRQMAQGVNTMVSGHIAVKKKAMTCIKAFGEGNFDAPLEQFPGKKAFINDTIEQVRRNLQALISASI